MKIVFQLFSTIAGTLSQVLGKASAGVLLLLIVTILLIPASLLLQAFLRRLHEARTGYQKKAMDAVAWRPGYKANDPGQQANETIYEYSLYGFVILLTALGVIFYIAGQHDQQISSLALYADALYFGSLAFAFHRLNALYRRRKLRDHAESGAHIELTRADGKRPASMEDSVRALTSGDSRTLMGLNGVQVAIAFAVFVAACLTFTWALTVLR